MQGTFVPPLKTWCQVAMPDASCVSLAAISVPDTQKGKPAMSIERFEAMVDRMTELHSEQEAADAEDTAENVLEPENLRLERRDLEARLGDQLKGVREYRGSPG